MFNIILENDLMGDNKVTHRHQKYGKVGGPMVSSRSQKLVPDYVKPDASEHPKIAQLKNQPTGKIILNDMDVRKISEVYGIKNLSTEEARECGTTGIMMSFNNRLGKYVLTKGEKY